MTFKRNTISVLTTVALMSTVSFSAVYAQSAQDLQKQVDALNNKIDALKDEVKKATDKSAVPLIVKWEPAPSIISPDGLFEMNMRGRVFTDFGWMSDSDETMDISASEVRQARLGVAGKAWRDVKYMLEIEFGGSGGAKLTDAYIAWGAPIEIKIGHFKAPVGMEPQISETNMTFLERASITSAFGMGRHLGAQGTFGFEGFSFSAGLFKGGQSDTSDNEGMIMAARTFYGHKEDDIAYHIGASYRNRKSGNDEAKFGYSQRPHHHLSNKFIDVGSAFKANKDKWMGVEVAGVYKSLSLQGEWGQVKSTIANPAAGQLNPTYKGGYAEVSYFLTGEKRNYSVGKGAFGSVSPINPIHEGGMGALHLAYRFDRMDLVGEGIMGGVQNTHIVALNWLLNKNVRLQVNYSKSKIMAAALVAANGADGRNKVNTLGFRASVSF